MGQQLPAVRVGDRVYIKSHVLSKATDHFNARLEPRRDNAYKVIHDNRSQIFIVHHAGLGPTMVHISEVRILSPMM